MKEPDDDELKPEVGLRLQFLKQSSQGVDVGSMPFISRRASMSRTAKLRRSSRLAARWGR